MSEWVEIIPSRPELVGAVIKRMHDSGARGMFERDGKVYVPMSKRHSGRIVRWKLDELSQQVGIIEELPWKLTGPDSLLGRWKRVTHRLDRERALRLFVYAYERASANGKVVKLGRTIELKEALRVDVGLHSIIEWLDELAKRGAWRITQRAPRGHGPVGWSVEVDAELLGLYRQARTDHAFDDVLHYLKQPAEPKTIPGIPEPPLPRPAPAAPAPPPALIAPAALNGIGTISIKLDLTAPSSDAPLILAELRSELEALAKKHGASITTGELAVKVELHG